MSDLGESIDRERLGAEALELAAQRGLDFHLTHECAWALLCDAAETFKLLPGDGPSVAQSAWPDMYRAKWENFAVERDRISDKVEVETTARRTPTPRQIDRAVEMLELMRPACFIGMFRRPDITVRAIWLYAGGSTPARIEKRLGLKPVTLREQRVRLCHSIGAAILPHLGKVAKTA